jgi:hypothetical protein
MNFADFLTLAPKLLPLVPEIEKAIATAQKIQNDPDVKAMLATAAQIAQILQQSGIKS